MRARTLAAGVAAMMLTHGLPSAVAAMAPSGPGSDTDAGGVLGVAARPGSPLTPNFRLRVELTAPRLVEHSIDPTPQPKRFGSMVDFYPDRASGFHLSAGMHVMSRKRKLTWNTAKPIGGGGIYAPSSSGSLRYRGNIMRTAPAVTLGWAKTLSASTLVGVEAGTLFARGGAKRSGASIAQPNLASTAWSRVDPVAQVAFAMRF